MIGIYFTHRREEFLEFACTHPIDYIELFDVSSLSEITIDTLYVDGPANVVGPFVIIDVKDTPFADVFSEIPDISEKKQKSINDILFQFDIFRKDIVKRVPILSIQPLVDEEAREPTTECLTPSMIPAVKEAVVLTPDLNAIFEGVDTSFESDFEIDSIEDSSVEQNTEKNDFEDIAAAPFAETQTIPGIFTKKRNTPRAAETSLFNSPQKSSPTVIRNTTLPSGFIHTRGAVVKKKLFQVPVFTFCGLTDKSGVSTLTISLAASLALSNPSARVLYLDLDMSNPNYMLNFMNLNPDTDASVKTIIQLSETEFMQNISLLTETITISQATLSLITWGQTSFQEKRMLASQDFNFFLNTICNSFDIILVDLGKFQSTLEYQLTLLRSNSAKHILLADGSTNRNVNVFIQLAKQLPCSFEVVINKDVPQAGSFAIRQQLRQSPIASVGLHRNIERYLNNQMPLQGTSFESDLLNLGGKL